MFGCLFVDGLCFVVLRKVNMKKLFLAFVASAMLLLSGCTRIQTGEVGVRVDMSRQIQGTELPPGSWNQTVIGSVLEFPVKDIALTMENRTPMTADNSALSDFDVTVIYNINPGSVAELYSTKSKAFHAEDKEGIYLMYNYISTLVNNAVYKSVRQYESLKVADNRVKIEEEIKVIVSEQLQAENLGAAITINTVQVRNILPNQQILEAATRFVASQNELRIKTTEVEIAKKESERMAALANNSTQSIAYMQAQAALNISEGIKEGKVQTIVVPANFNALMLNK
jgi:regulator of protease activity HflC (stomatin/prohibitin superfamily)